MSNMKTNGPGCCCVTIGTLTVCANICSSHSPGLVSPGGDDTGNLAGAVIVVKKGDTVVATGTTGSGGCASFTGIPQDTYSVSITYTPVEDLGTPVSVSGAVNVGANTFANAYLPTPGDYFCCPNHPIPVPKLGLKLTTAYGTIPLFFDPTGVTGGQQLYGYQTITGIKGFDMGCHPVTMDVRVRYNVICADGIDANHLYFSLGVSWRGWANLCSCPSPLPGDYVGGAYPMPNSGTDANPWPSFMSTNPPDLCHQAGGNQAAGFDTAQATVDSPLAVMWPNHDASFPSANFPFKLGAPSMSL